MNIEIYQIDTDMDYDGVCFRHYDELEDLQGTTDIDSSIYVKVFSGEVNCKDLNEVYMKFNLYQPSGYKGRSMSISDVIAIKEENETKYYYCDSNEFIDIKFEPEETREKTITVVMCQPGKLAEVVEIGTELKDLQEAVGGGFFQTYYFSQDEEVCIVCNDEGKINGMPLNRSIKIDGKVVEILAGPFFICDCSTTNFGSLSKEQQDKYMKMFKYPELFFKAWNEIQAIPYNPDKMREKGGER